MTDAEKVVAFDLLASALINRWHDGTFSIWGGAMWEQPHRTTPEECISDLIDWAKRRKPNVSRVNLALVPGGDGGPA